MFEHADRHLLYSMQTQMLVGFTSKSPVCVCLRARVSSGMFAWVDEDTLWKMLHLVQGQAKDVESGRKPPANLDDTSPQKHTHEGEMQTHERVISKEDDIQ